MKTTKQMFGKVARDLNAMERAARQDEADRAQYAAERDVRLDAPITRREVLEALESVANLYGCAGSEGNDLIADAFRKLAEALS